MKIAIYGGSFNPPHLGHVEAARTVASALAPDRLLIVPASVPPHKELADGSPTAQQRLELCRLAFADIPGAEISEMELRREGKSYSYDTVRLLRPGRRSTPRSSDPISQRTTTTSPVSTASMTSLIPRSGTSARSSRRS